MIDILALAIYTFVMSITPGPNNIMVTASGANFGFRRTLPHMAGITLGFAGQTLLVCAGFGTLFLLYPAFQRWLAWAGGAYLVYIAWKLLGAGAVGSASSSRPLRAWEASLFQFVNPKAWVGAVTIAALFMPAGGNVYLAAVYIVLVICLIVWPCVALWTAFGSAMRRFLEQPKRRLAFNAVMAILLLATAFVMIRDAYAGFE